MTIERKCSTYCCWAARSICTSGGARAGDSTKCKFGSLNKLNIRTTGDGMNDERCRSYARRLEWRLLTQQVFWRDRETAFQSCSCSSQRSRSTASSSSCGKSPVSPSPACSWHQPCCHTGRLGYSRTPCSTIIYQQAWMRDCSDRGRFGDSSAPTCIDHDAMWVHSCTSIEPWHQTWWSHIAH